MSDLMTQIMTGLGFNFGLFLLAAWYALSGKKNPFASGELQSLKDTIVELQKEDVKKDREISNLQRDLEALKLKYTTSSDQVVELLNELKLEREAREKAESNEETLKGENTRLDRELYGKKQANEALTETIMALTDAVSRIQVTVLSEVIKASEEQAGIKQTLAASTKEADNPENNDGPAQKDLSETLIDEKSQIE